MYKGEDKKIILNLKRDDETALVFGAGENLIVLLSVNEKELEKYSYVEMEDYEPIVDGAVTGEYKLLIKRDQSKEFPAGKLKAEIMIKLNEDDFEDGYHTVAIAEITTIQEAKTKAI